MTANGTERKLIWALAPPLAYIFLSVILLRLDAGRTWDLISIPGTAIALILGFGGGFEAGMIAATALNLLVYGLAGFLATCASTNIASLAIFLFIPTVLFSLHPQLVRRRDTQMKQILVREAEKQAVLEREPRYRQEKAERHFKRGVQAWIHCQSEIGKIALVPPPNACYEWRGSIRDFENVLRYAGKEDAAHRCRSHLHLATLNAGLAQSSASNAKSNFDLWRGCGLKPLPIEAPLIDIYKLNIGRIESAQSHFHEIK